MNDHIYIFNPPQVFGGAEVFLIRLAELLKISSEYVVISPALPPLQLGLSKFNGRFVELSGTGSIAIRLAFLKWLWRHRRDIREKASAFVLNGRGAAYFAPVVRFVIGTGPVVICHTEVSQKSANIKDWLYGAALRFARCSVAVSNTVEAQHRGRWPSLHVRAIPNWIDGSSATQQPVPACAGSSVLEIAVIGRLAENKGVMDIASVCASMNGVQAHFYGEGPLRGYLENIASTVTSLKVHGHVSDLSSRLSRHAIVLSGSYSESFSYAVAEGIHAGLLCVVSDIPAHRELLGPDYPEKLYFSPGDTGGMKQALNVAKQLLTNTGGDAARHAVSQAYMRMRTRNAPDSARESYQRVFFGNESWCESRFSG